MHLYLLYIDMCVLGVCVCVCVDGCVCGGGGGGDLRQLSPVICKSHELHVVRLEAHRLHLLSGFSS